MSRRPRPRAAHHLGHVQRDVLDSLRTNGPASIYELADATGRPYQRIHSALTKLLAAGLVEREGHAALGRDGFTSFEWRITRQGKADLRLRERIGHEPGVINTAVGDGRLAARWGGR